MDERVRYAYWQITQGGAKAEHITEGVPEGIIIFRVTDTGQAGTYYTPYLPQQAIQGFETVEDAVAHAQGKTPQRPGRFLWVHPIR